MTGIKRLMLVGFAGILLPMLAFGISPVIDQEHYQWRNDDNVEATASQKANVDIAIINQARAENIRLRFCIAYTTGSYDATVFARLEYAESVDGAWTAVGTDGTGITAFEMELSSYYSDGDATTSLLDGTGTFVSGKMIEKPSNTSESIRIAIEHYTNVEYCFRATAKAKGDTTYYFRVSNNGADLTAYSEYAALTMEAGEADELPQIGGLLTAEGSITLPFTYAIQASGSEPITYGVTGIPAGLTFDGLDTISGTAVNPGTYNVGLTASNPHGSDSNTLVLTVIDNTPPTAYPRSTIVLSGQKRTLYLSRSDPDPDQTFTYILTSGPDHGVLEYPVNTTVWNYISRNDYVGTDSFTWKCNDGLDDSNIATYSITVNGTPPSPRDQSEKVGKNVSSIIQAAYFGGGGYIYNVIKLTDPAHGTLTVDGTKFVYTPVLDYVGTDSFTWNISYSNATTPLAQTITVTCSLTVKDGINGIAYDQKVVAIENVAASAALEHGFCPTPIFSVVDDPANGSVVISGENFVYTPAVDYTGLDSFTWQVSDGSTNSNVATCRILVRAEDSRGGMTVLLVVKDTLLPEIANEVTRWKVDLENEGYVAKIKSWSSPDTQELWDYLVAEYETTGQFVAGATLIGNLPIARGVTSNEITDYALMNMETYRDNGMNKQHIWVSRIWTVDFAGGEVMRAKWALDANHGYRTGTHRLPYGAYWWDNAYGAVNEANSVNTLIVWPTIEHLFPLDVFKKGGEFQNTEIHSDGAFAGTSWHPTQLRYSVHSSCGPARLGGPVNLNISTYGGGLVLSVGSTATAYSWQNVVMDDINYFNALAAGDTFGNGIVRPNLNPYRDFDRDMFYGDLSLPAMMAPSNAVPVISSFICDKSSGAAPLTVNFSVAANDPDGTVTNYEWFMRTFNMGIDGPDYAGLSTNCTHTYTIAHRYPAEVQVVDNYMARTWTTTPIVVAPEPGVPLRVNCGATGESMPTYFKFEYDYTDGASNLWLHDQNFVSGTWGAVGGWGNGYTSLDVIGTDEDILYQRYRRDGPISYHIPLSNGAYTLRLGFADMISVGIGERVLDVDVEGVPWLTEFEPYAEVGPKSAIQVAKYVEVTDGELTFEVRSNPIATATLYKDFLNCFEVIPIAGGNTEPTIDEILPTTSHVMDEGTSQSFTVTASDADDDALNYTWAFNGTVLAGVITSNWVYSPGYTSAGNDTLSVTVDDARGGSVVQVWNIEVTDVNGPPVAQNQTVITTQDTAVAIVLTALDPDDDSMTYWVVSDPTNGVLSGTAPNLSYTPASGFTGIVDFEFHADDGTLTGSVAVVTVRVGIPAGMVRLRALDQFGNNVEDAQIYVRELALWYPNGSTVQLNTNTFYRFKGQVLNITGPEFGLTIDAEMNNIDVKFWTATLRARNQYGVDVTNATIHINAVTGTPFAPGTVLTLPKAYNARFQGKVPDLTGPYVFFPFTDGLVEADPGFQKLTVHCRDQNNDVVPDGLAYIRLLGAQYFPEDSVVTVPVDDEIDIRSKRGALVATVYDLVACSNTMEFFEPKFRKVLFRAVAANSPVLVPGVDIEIYNDAVPHFGNNEYQVLPYDDIIRVQVRKDNLIIADISNIIVDETTDVIEVVTSWLDDGTPSYIITASAGAGGSISPANDVVVYEGMSQAFTISEDAGYVINDVVVDGGSKGTLSVYTFTNVTATHTIAATFAADALPTISDIADTTIDEDTATSAIAFTIGDVETPAGSLSLSKASDNTTLVPTANITFGGSDANRTVTVTPAANKSGTATITVTVTDNGGKIANDSFVLTVNAVNDAPVAVDDSDATEENSAVEVAVLINDTDADGDILSVSAVSDPPNGSAVSDGTNVTYTPDTDYIGDDVFTYTVSDGNGCTDTGTVTVAVTEVNDVPVAVDDSDSTAEDTAVVVPVLTNDSDANGDALTVLSVSDPFNGVAVSDGINVTYTPDVDWNGVDSFSYTISDGKGGTDTANVSVTVAAVNDAPVAQGAVLSTEENQAVGIILHATDVETSTLTYVLDSLPTDGTLTNFSSSVGTVTYIPNAGFAAVDTFTFHAYDGTTNGNIATVTITVTSGSDFVCKIRSATEGGDYTNLSTWETAIESDLTLSGSMIFNVSDIGTYDASIDDTGTVTFAGSGTGTLKHINVAGKAYIVDCVGTIQAGEVVCDASGRTFTIADAGKHVGLVVAECYNDWPAGLQDQLTIADWVTDSDNYIKIYTPESERHDCTPDTGFRMLGTDYRFVINNQVPYTRIEGISIYGNGKLRASGFSSGGGGTRIEKCLAYAFVGTASRWCYSSSSGAPAGYSSVVNCMAVDSYSGFLASYYSSTIFVRFNNCSAVGVLAGGTGFAFNYVDDARICYVKNCLAEGAGTGFSLPAGRAGVNLEYCASSDATADANGGIGNRVNQTFTFVDASNGDYHIDALDTGALGYGLDLSSMVDYPFADDVDGDLRTGAWDIGADEVVVAPAPDNDGDGTPDATDPDDDNDGMPDEWEIAYGFDPLVNEGTGADPDTDGMSNLDESICGTNPYDENSKLETGNLTMGGTGVDLTFDTVIGRTYGVEYKDDLLAVTWQLLTNNVSGTGGAVNVNDPELIGRRFYRIRVTLVE